MKRTQMPSFNDLLQKFIRDELTQEELQAFLELVREPANQAIVKEAVDHHMDAEKFTDLTAGMDMDLQFMQVLKKAEQETSMRSSRPVHRVHFIRKWWWAAAAVLLMLATSTYFLLRPEQKVQVAAKQPVDIAPGKEGAILTLADGTKVILDSLGNGMVATQNGAQVILENGQLTYDPVENINGEITYNTMTTPKGRQFQLLLPDGTKVWLNAASSISYPTAFAGADRKVTITGEVYFEVAKNKNMPFRVNANNKAAIEVLGTHFNVNAYQDEAEIKTTLLEGSVKLSKLPVMADAQVPADQKIQMGSSVLLKPGQQGIIQAGSPANLLIPVQPAEIDKVVAWKNGLFNFEGASIGEVMKQLERWYDITVVYEKGIPDIKFFGEIGRNVTLADLIVALEDVGVHFRIDAGRKLIVLP
jgi:transmembrane sensor